MAKAKRRHRPRPKGRGICVASDCTHIATVAKYSLCGCCARDPLQQEYLIDCDELFTRVVREPCSCGLPGSGEVVAVLEEPVLHKVFREISKRAT